MREACTNSPIPAKAVGRATFPTREPTYNGTTIWRCLIPLSSVDHLSITKYTAFHHGPRRMFKCSVVSTREEIEAGEGLWEMTLRSYEDPETAQGTKYSWGVPASNERVAEHFTVREGYSLVLGNRCCVMLMEGLIRLLHRRSVRRSTKRRRGLGESSLRFLVNDCSMSLRMGTSLSLEMHLIPCKACDPHPSACDKVC